MVSQAEVDQYITDIRTAVTEYADKLAKKQKLGRSDIFYEKIRLILLSAYLDCVIDYFIQYDPNDPTTVTTNLCTTSELRDVMQHVNNICGTEYIINF